MRRILLALGAVLAFGWAAAHAVPEATSNAGVDLDAERAALRAALAKTQDKDPDDRAIADGLKAVIADPAFPFLEDAERHAAYAVYAAALFDLKNYAEAKLAIEQASAMNVAGQIDWELRLRNDYMLEDHVDSARAITVLAQKWPDSLKTFDDRMYFYVGNDVVEKAPDVALAYLDALHGIGWQPDDPFRSAGGLWMSLTRLHVERGEFDAAKAAAADVHDAMDLIILHADKRFDRIVAASPDGFDVGKAVQVKLDRDRRNSSAAPGKLAGVDAVAQALLSLGRAQEALDLLNDARDRLKAKPDAFDDTDDHLSWTLDLRAQALFALGRSDEGLAAMTEGAATKENGSVNVSEAINLADEYVNYDRPKDALAAVAALQFSQASPYGRMALEDARACAYYELGDQANLAKSLDYMKAHTKDGLQPYLNAMLCTKDFDAVAHEVITELNDPARRDLVLYYLQDYLPLPHPSPRAVVTHADWLAVRSRPDVAAAIARVGRIETYALVPPGY